MKLTFEDPMTSEDLTGLAVGKQWFAVRLNGQPFLKCYPVGSYFWAFVFGLHGMSLREINNNTNWYVTTGFSGDVCQTVSHPSYALHPSRFQTLCGLYTDGTNDVEKELKKLIRTERLR